MTKKLTILYLCSDHTMGGSTASLWNLIQSVKNEVYPIVIFPKDGEGYDFFLRQGIECYIYPYLLLYLFSDNNLWDVILHPWRWHYIKKWRFDRGCCKFVKSILNGRKIDIVHTNVSPVDVGVKLSKALNAKHVWHVRECMDIHGDFNIYKRFDKLFDKIRQADAIIPISNFVKEHFKLPEDRAFVINDAVRSKEDIYYVIPKGKYVLFSSYCLTKAKGTSIAIEAFDKSGLAELGYTLKLMGNVAPEYEDELMETIERCSCKESIEFVLCQSDVKPFFARASVFVMASDYEGLGRVTAEAMFFGCPVIARATGGTLDIVKNGETGYLFDTVEECAELLKKVCTTDQTDMIMRAQQFVYDNLSVEVYGPKIMNVYKKVLENE